MVQPDSLSREAVVWVAYLHRCLILRRGLFFKKTWEIFFNVFVNFIRRNLVSSVVEGS